MKEGNMTALPDKVVISCAITGVAADRKQCPHIPYTVEEMAEETQRAYEAGASVVHLHAREDDGSPSFRAERYREMMEAIREKCPIIINFSTGAIGVPIEERVAHLEDSKPEIGALNMGSMNYAIYSEKKKKFYMDLVFENKFKDITFFLEKMKKSGVHPECECFDGGHIGNSRILMDQGLLEGISFHYSLIMGVYGGMPASTKNLVNQVSLLPRDATWQVIGISLAQWHMTAAALSMGGHVRVGFEDNFYLEKGKMAKSNGELVEKAAQMARMIGREPASVEEAREILDLPSFDEAVKRSEEK